jgi:hypothetical protein
MRADEKEGLPSRMIAQNEADVIIAKYDADTQRKHATMHGVSGYPTIKIFSGTTTPKATEVYEGSRHVACGMWHVARGMF